MFFIVDQVTILKQSLALIWADFLEVRLEWEKISPPPLPPLRHVSLSKTC